MVMLGEQPAGGDETGTADGRFFNAHNMIAATLQHEIAELAAECRAEEAPHIREMYRPPIESAVRELGEVIRRSEGAILIGGLRQQLARVDEYDISAFTAEHSNAYAVPASRITGVIALTGWYGTGHDVSPVVNLRIQTRHDKKKKAYVFTRHGQWDPTVLHATEYMGDGAWHKLVIGEGTICLASD